MRKSRFTEEQIAFALKQAETGTPVAEVIRRMGVSEQTFYRWKKLYGGLGTGELRRLRQLEEENRKLKQLVADLSLDKHILQDVLAKKPDAWSATRTRAAGAGHARGERAPQLCGSRRRQVERALSLDQGRSGGASIEDPRSRQDPGSLRLLSDLHPAAARGLDGQSQTHLPALPRGRSEPEAEASPPARQRGRSGAPARGGAAERAVVDGLRLGRSVRWSAVAGADRGRCVHARGAGDRGRSGHQGRTGCLGGEACSAVAWRTPDDPGRQRA